METKKVSQIEVKIGKQAQQVSEGAENSLIREKSSITGPKQGRGLDCQIPGHTDLTQAAFRAFVWRGDRFSVC